MAKHLSPESRERKQARDRARRAEVRERLQGGVQRDDMAMHRMSTMLQQSMSAQKKLLRDLADAQDRIASFQELAQARPIAPFVEANTKGKNPTQRQGCPVMLCSDWHVEERVDAATVNGLNEYNLQIAERCIDRMADAFEWFNRDPRYDCRQGVVWLGGDLFSGYIHEELVENNFLSPTEACLWLQERIERMLRKIAASCPNLERIVVPCNDGNHGRLTHKIRASTRTKNSLEWFMFHNLARRMKDDPRFEFQIADGEWNYLDIFKFSHAFTHGDSFRYQGGVGGISIPLRRGVNEIRKYRRVDHVDLGHFHQLSDFGDICVNGSMIGINGYSMRIHASPEARKQLWYMVDAKKGKCISAPIWL